tara:strand:+ start:1460 stop:1741 length:282 start_codon:yes stop_codon:yes gene_type:complete
MTTTDLYMGTPIIHSQGKSEGLAKVNYDLTLEGVYSTPTTLRALDSDQTLQVQRDNCFTDPDCNFKGKCPFPEVSNAMLFTSLDNLNQLFTNL